MAPEEKLNVHDLYQKMSKIGLQGWIDDKEGEVLRREIERVPEGGIYLEIGVAWGKSLSTVCYYAHPSINIWGIDTLNWKEKREGNMAKLGVSGRATFIEGDSQQEAMRWEDPIDLLFIDGDHNYYGITKDLLSWIPFVKHGGRIVLHDYDKTSPGIMTAVHEFIYPHNAYKDFEQVLSMYSFTKI